MKLNARRLSATLAALALIGAIVAAPTPALADTIADTISADESTEAAIESPAEAPVESEPETPAEVAPEADADAPAVLEENPAETVDEPVTDSPAAPPVDAPREPQDDAVTPAAVAPAAVVDGLGFTIDRAWADPTVLTSGRPFFSATMLHPLLEPGDFAVTQANPVTGLSTSSNCQITRPENGVIRVNCSFAGTPNPGDSQITVRLRSEGGADYSATLPITMCPLTGCSPLFDVTAVQTEAIEVCPDEQLAGSFVYDFNVAWNASGAALGEEAPDGLTLDAGSVRDGGAFSIAGAVSEPGEYSIPIVVTDEFGVEHSTSVAVTITEPVPGVCGVALEEEEEPEPEPQPEAAPELAHTGIDATSGVNLAAFALVLVLAGALAAQRATRERSSLSIR